LLGRHETGRHFRKSRLPQLPCSPVQCRVVRLAASVTLSTSKVIARLRRTQFAKRPPCRERTMRDITPSSAANPTVRPHPWRDWLRRRFPALYRAPPPPESETARPPECRSAAPVAPPKANSELAQFHGLHFRANDIDFDTRAADNDAAIRASFIYFKHRWPGRPAEIEGTLAFRVRAWRIAQEVGVRIKGAPPRAAPSNSVARKVPLIAR
jgi:hypothetical protein